MEIENEEYPYFKQDVFNEETKHFELTEEESEEEMDEEEDKEINEDEKE